MERIDPQLFAIGDVEHEIAEHPLSGLCPTPRPARRRCRGARSHGLDDWTIEHAVTDDDDPDACATYAFDEARSVGSIIMLKMPP